MLDTKSINEVCIECQVCCRKLGWRLWGDENQVRLTQEFYAAWGFEIISVEDGKEFYGILDHPCQHITPTGCDMYPNRPTRCRNYMGCTDPVLKRFCRLELVRKESL